MRIEDEIKLTFDDVLIRPKRSTLISRSQRLKENLNLDTINILGKEFLFFLPTWILPVLLKQLKHYKAIKCSLLYINFTTLEDWKTKYRFIRPKLCICNSWAISRRL